MQLMVFPYFLQSHQPQGMLALIDAVLADERADATLRRLAALARSEMNAQHRSSNAPSAFQASSDQTPPLTSAFNAKTDPLLYTLGSTDSPRLPVSVLAPQSAGGSNQNNGAPESNMMHPF